MQPKRSDVAIASEIPMRDFSASLPMALLQAREAAMQLFRPLLARHDLTEQQWRVLRALSAATTPIEVGEIVDRTFLLAPSLSRILKGLEGRGLLHREVVATDNRRSEIMLTATGHELVATVAPQSESVYNQIEASFGEPRLSALLHELAELRDRTIEIQMNHDDTTEIEGRT